MSRAYASAGTASGAERDLDLDLDRSPARQRGDTDRRPAVPTGRTEHVREEPARTVDDRRLFDEPRGGIVRKVEFKLLHLNSAFILTGGWISTGQPKKNGWQRSAASR